ncbi:MAG: hypothetical protein KKB85_02795, partial [Candidatus Altiarchaeota archaeon]|nr:hypothetical protein [Candidatus Altiarchaeota archaeon]
MRVLTILLLLSILCLTASADEPKIIGCSCDCPGVPSAYLPEIFANGTNETNCQSACGGVCGAMSPCGFSADECSACCDTYCSGVIPHGAVQSCNGNCMQRCELNSIVGETISMLSYVAVAIAAALLAVCGIRIITSDDPDIQYALLCRISVVRVFGGYDPDAAYCSGVIPHGAVQSCNGN